MYIILYYIIYNYIYICIYIFILNLYIIYIIIYIDRLNPSHWSSKPFTIDIINPRVVADFATTAIPGAAVRQEGHGGKKMAIEKVDLLMKNCVFP